MTVVPEEDTRIAEKPEAAGHLFTRQALIRLIIPLMIEQALAVTIGVMDSMMVAGVGEEAISAINLVDQINNLLITVFAAMATGGTVVVSQYIGHKEIENARHTAGQLILSVFAIAVGLAGIALLGNRFVLQLVSGNVEEKVMGSARTYFRLAALSYPFLALYNGGAALFRAQGNSKISMVTSLIINGVNMCLNALFIYGFGMEVFGAGLATLIARASAAVAVMAMLRKQKNMIYVRDYRHLRPDFSSIRRILKIGIPTGLENGLFMVGKILVARQVAVFGTVAIAANAVTLNMAGFQSIAGNGISLAMVTVVGQCVGADRYDEVRYYVKRLLLFTCAILLVVNLALIPLYPVILPLYHLQAETQSIAQVLILVYSGWIVVLWPMAFWMPNVLRAAGDAKYTMMVSVVSMWLFRIVLCYAFAAWTDWELYGVWVAWGTDWVARAVCFAARYLSGKWKGKKVI